MKLIKTFTLIALMLLISACSTRMGDFTALSSMNVRNLDYAAKDNTIARTEGDTCIHSIFLIPVGHFDDRLRRALDDAILNGRKRGLDGDLLVNARVNQTIWTTFIYGQDCVSVEGDLVSIIDK